LHVNERLCIEAIAVKGEKSKLVELNNRLGQIRGILKARLLISFLMKRLSISDDVIKLGVFVAMAEVSNIDARFSQQALDDMIKAPKFCLERGRPGCMKHMLRFGEHPTPRRGEVSGAFSAPHLCGAVPLVQRTTFR